MGFTVVFAPLNKDAIGQQVYIELALVAKASDLGYSTSAILDEFMDEFEGIGLKEEELTVMYKKVAQLLADRKNTDNKWNRFQSILKEHSVNEKYKEAKVEFEAHAKWAKVKQIFGDS